jgi:hypothetical protein
VQTFTLSRERQKAERKLRSCSALRHRVPWSIEISPESSTSRRSFFPSQRNFPLHLHSVTPSDSSHVVQSRSPFLQCLPPTGRPHRQAHGPKKRILIRSRNQCQHPRTSSVAPPTALVLSRRSQDCPLLGSHHEVGSRPRRCRRLCSSRRIAFALAERCPHGYWFDLDPLVLCH